MTKLWLLSDLHLESAPHPDRFDPPRPDFDVLVCAGDVWETRTDLGMEALRRLAGDKPVVTVMGNHEHWHGEIAENLQLARLSAEANGVTLLEGEATTIEGTRPDGTSFGPVRFAGTTLWSDYGLASPSHDRRAETGEPIVIAHDGGEHWCVALDTIALFEAASERLTALVDAHEARTREDADVPLVVVTHHAPHPDCLGVIAPGSWEAGACASDLSHLTDRGTIALWAHGHIHSAQDLRRPAPGDGEGAPPSGTRIVRNPAGHHCSAPDFDEGLVIEV